MSDLICRKTMTRCHTPGMCSPFGGCRPSILKEVDVRYSNCSQPCVAAVERDGANERAGLLLKAKNEWSERARSAESELDQARRTAEHWKAEHLAGNAVIDQLRAEVEQCAVIAAQNASDAAELYAEVEALRRLLDEAGQELKEMKVAIGFRANTLSLIERIDAAMAAKEGV